MKDTAIIHVSDLHFGEHILPPWSAALSQAVEKLASNTSLTILGIAATGDLANSPSPRAYYLLRDYFASLLTSANLTTKANGQLEADWSRLWLVPGNHDHKQAGWIVKREDGLTACRALDTLKPDKPFTSPCNQFEIYGLDSGSGLPAFARGAIAYDELKALEDTAKSLGAVQEKCDTIRIALVHHHLLPLPEQPSEWNSGMETLRRRIEDESVMLLGNAGLATKVLADNGFKLVLHGHRHKAFRSRIQFSNGKDWSPKLLVLGAPAASSGFGLIVFDNLGDAKLIPYSIDVDKYKPDRPVSLWTAASNRQSTWSNQARMIGWIEEVKVSNSLSTIGDSVVQYKYKGIHAPSNGKLSRIEFSFRSFPKERGCIRLEKLTYHSTGQSIDLSATHPPRPEFDYCVDINPPIDDEVTHDGFTIERTSFNNYAVSKIDARLRAESHGEYPVDAKSEMFRIQVRLPTRKLSGTILFPAGAKPLSVGLRCSRQLKDGTYGEDLAETGHIADNIEVISVGSSNIAHFHLNWALPDRAYDLIWELPDTAGGAPMDSAWSRAIAMTDSCLARIHRCGQKDKHSWVNRAIFELKRNLLVSGLGDEGNAERGELDVSLLAYDETTKVIRPAGGTYDSESPFWRFELPWGLGIRGLALRRGRAEFWFSEEGRKDIFYMTPPTGVSKERFLLAVPISLDPKFSPSQSGQEGIPIGYFRAVISIASCSKTSGMRSLLQQEPRDSILKTVKDWALQRLCSATY